MNRELVFKSVKLALAGAMLAACVAGFPGISFAQQKAEISEIKSVPTVCSPEAIRQGAKEELGIPWFNGDGIIMEIGDDYVILSDLKFGLAPGVVFRSERTGKYLSSSDFQPGVTASYVLNQQGLIVSLWK